MSDGVSFYTRAFAGVDIYFPHGEEACKWCKLFLRYEENFRRYSCRLTDDLIPDPFHGRGHRCPLVMESEEE